MQGDQEEGLRWNRRQKGRGPSMELKGEVGICLLILALLCANLANSISFSVPLYHFPVSFLRLSKMRPKDNAKNNSVL